MVGYDEKSQHQLSWFWQGVAGTSSGVITRLLCQPLDVIKIRFQLQHEPIKKSVTNYYWNIKQATQRIFQEESYRALWKGHVPAQILSGSYGLAQFLSFEILTKYLGKELEWGLSKTSVHFICGCISGGVATTASMPFDTVRTRLVGQGEPKIYRGVLDAFATMIKNEGFLSLYKGLTPNLIQIVPHTGMQFGFFRVFTEFYRKTYGNDESQKLPVLANLACGSSAGLVAKLAIYPLDLTKKRLQVQGFETARLHFGKVRVYSGMMHCLLVTIKEEGLPGLYKGLAPSCIKAMVTTGLVFGLYEEISHLIAEFQS